MLFQAILFRQGWCFSWGVISVTDWTSYYKILQNFQSSYLYLDFTNFLWHLTGIKFRAKFQSNMSS